MGFAAQAHNRQMQFSAQVPQVSIAQITQLHMLELLPYTLIRIQVRRVRRQLLQMKELSTTCREEGLYFTLVNGRTIPDHQHLAAQVPPQMLQEQHAMSTGEPLLTNRCIQ